MIVFDTSLVVRIATGDSRRQRRAAFALLESDTVLIPKTVLLETEWVLRSRYELTSTEIHGFLHYLVESERVVVEDDSAVRRALGFYAAGADFADALHLASAGEALLHTFDRTFCSKAIRKGKARVVKA
ncbi:MAG: type II toxin-antitoxin system VapC family toxin [Steroidobacteraceae bacterium]